MYTLKHYKNNLFSVNFTASHDKVTHFEVLPK